MWVLYVIVALLLVAGLSAGSALALHIAAPRMALRKRIIIAALIGALLPMSVAWGGFLSEAGELLADETSGFVLGFLALLVLQFLLLATCCLPPAWYTATRLAGAKTAAIEADEDEQPLLEG